MRRVKSGCRTCKIRKIKCDEGRPICRRCVSTGRICDGYGISPPNRATSNHASGTSGTTTHHVALGPSKSVSILAVDAEEELYLEWFQCRTAKKIPGIFVLTFWDTLIIQASFKELAVLHAILTLSSVHKTAILHDSNQANLNRTLDQQDQFMLKQYSKAINHVQTHLSINDGPSLRVALITCAVFVCLEFLRGRLRTAETHLQSGLRVIQTLQARFTGPDSDPGIVQLSPSSELVDNWIIEAFSRLQVQVMLLKQTYQQPCLVLQSPELQQPVYIFKSLSEARQHLERSLTDIFRLAGLVSESKSASLTPSRELVWRQQRIKAQLAHWLVTFEASKETLQAQYPKAFACQLLYVYHTVASIMTDTCLRRDDESIFDSHTERFIYVIKELSKIWVQKSVLPKVRPLPDGHFIMSRSAIDIGWIPPLYYTALKCRVHRVRLQAVRLLESSSHREGIWDSNIAARITRKVMELEEKDFYRDLHPDDGFSLSSSPSSGDISLPTLPQSNRIHVVDFVLPDGPTDHYTLYCRQKITNGYTKSFAQEYHPCQRAWLEVTV